MVPPASGPRTPALTEFASAVKLEVDGSFAKALPILSKPLLTDHPLSDYAQYYKGLANCGSAVRLTPCRRSGRCQPAVPSAIS
jgi:hypothetical protein